ncbi:MAG: glycoside hydrolase family 43 protein [Bacilli bacterium]
MKYILSYFKTEDESMYLAQSADGFMWDEVNEGKAVLNSTIGSETIRDPFLLETEKGFIMLTTNGWYSEQIVCYQSQDLCTWTDGKLIDFSGNGFVNCWAPEAKKIGEDYYIYWSSSKEVANKNDWNHRIYYTKTKDFKHFSKPSIFLDCDYSCIDGTLFESDNQLLMCFKDERLDVPTEKSLKLAIFDKELEIFKPFENSISKTWVEGPTVFNIEGCNYIYYDEYTRNKWGMIKSSDIRQWDEVDSQLFKLPAGVRHGSILRLENNYDI